jgi:signal transduction histidine kinase
MGSVDRPDPSAPTAAGSATRGPASRDRILRLLRRAGLGVVAAILALATLAVVPWSASRRLASVRLDNTATVAPARQYVRDIGAALALEVAVGNASPARTAPELARRYDEAVAMEGKCDSALGALALRLGDTLAGDIARLRSLSAQWHAERSGNADGTGASLAAVLATAARLDSALAERQAQQAGRIQSLEALDVLLPSVLVPLLAAVLLLINRTGRRMAVLANEAEQSHLALAVASEQRVTLLRGLTHDLKNALGAAAGFATLLRDEIAGPLTTLQRDHVARIGRIIEQTILAVEDALMIARTEAGTLPVRRRPEDLRVLVLESASDYVAAAEGARLALIVEFAEDIPRVETDRSLVSKIIGNLLSNAIKYTPPEGRIWLCASFRAVRAGSVTGPWVAIEVCDTGPGVPPALREQVFHEFFRAPTATTSARGEGIGLAMSRRVARLLGGDITLGSEEGKGATFTLWLPAASRDAARPEGSPLPGGRPPDADETRTTDPDADIIADERRAGAPPHPCAPGAYDRRRSILMRSRAVG